MTRGFTLIETVVAVGVFAMLSVIGSTLLFGILRGSKKAASVVVVRTEGANILNSLTQTIRFAEEISVCNGTSITFRPLVGNDITYSCTGTNIASGSANLNSSQVTLSACAISCPLTTSITDVRKAKYVDLSFTLKGSQAEIPFKTQVVLRNRD
ncbi:type II secretion system protein [Candidatus Amesbacteria bacterium]|nr:type II secretion system protein [Candidatus Amesbacteria bacterium]